MEVEIVGWTFWKSSLKRDQIAEDALCLPPVAFVLPAWSENMMAQTLIGTLHHKVASKMEARV